MAFLSTTNKNIQMYASSSSYNIDGNSSNDRSPGSIMHEIRINFLLFIKILFQLLKKAGDELLLEQAKLIVYQCQEGAPSQSILRQMVGIELHKLVGEYRWEQAKKYTIAYLKRKKYSEDQQVRQRYQKAQDHSMKDNLICDMTNESAQFSNLIDEQDLADI